MIDFAEMMRFYDWREAFQYANFSIDDVAEVLKADQGENDGAKWLAVGRLKNGQYFILRAWCDYTGWDCRADGDTEIADTLDDLVRWRLGDDDRQRLGYVLPAETDGAPLPVVEEKKK